MRIGIYYLLILGLLVWSCECPPNLNTDKIYLPRESSYLSIINLLNNDKPYDVYSMNIKIYQLKQISTITNQTYFKFQSGIVDFKLQNNDSTIFKTIIQTQKGEFYTMLFFQNNQEIENLLISENIDKSKMNLYLKFANYSSIDKVKFVLVSDLPQNFEYNLIKNGITDNIAFPSIPFSLQVYKLPDNELIAKIENITINLENITYFILTGDAKDVKIFQINNNYKI